jgi:hypothetical protein
MLYQVFAVGAGHQVMVRSAGQPSDVDQESSDYYVLAIPTFALVFDKMKLKVTVHAMTGSGEAVS